MEPTFHNMQYALKVYYKKAKKKLLVFTPAAATPLNTSTMKLQNGLSEYYIHYCVITITYMKLIFGK